jgi:hypothetical protein
MGVAPVVAIGDTFAVAVTYPSERVAPAARPPGGTRGWRWIASAAPVAAVLAVMAIGGVIAAYVHDTNRRGAVVLSNDLIDAVDQRIALQMGAYLQPADQFLESARAIAGERGVFDGALAVEPFVLATIARYPQLTGFSYGDPEGNFLYITRNAQGGLDTKLIDRRGGGRKVTWTRRNGDGTVAETADDPDDTFDVLTRSWFKGAVEEGKPFWTSPYLFFTVRRPGITYALPHYGADRRLVSVLGIDIELADLSTFLKSLEIGVHGKAMVVDARGRVIAYPSDDWMAKTREGAALPQLDDLGDATLTRIYNRLRVEGFSRKVLEVDGQRIIVSSGALRALTGRNWSVLIVARESDLLGFVQSSGWLALALSAVVFLLIVALAALMMWRSVRAERRDRAARERQQALEARAQTLTELAAASHLMDRASIEGVREATERAADICGGKRVGVWYLAAAGRTLVCEDNFDRAVHAHTAGAELHRDEFPHLFEALEAMTEIDAPYAARDPRTRELSAHYLRPLGIEGVHITPIHSGNRLLGMLKVEDPVRGDGRAGMAAFSAALASLFALRYLPAVAQPAAYAEAAGAQRAIEQIENALGERQAGLEHRLLHYALSPADLTAGRIEQAAVAVVRLPDWLTVATRVDGGQRARMDAVIERIQETVNQSSLAYAALLDDQVILAAHSAGRPPAVKARIVAMVALELRNRLLELMADWGEGSEFRIAIDIGPVMATRFGNDSYSLWGGAVVVAKVLATSGGRRAITVSETAYQILSGDFLFRQRGTYFLPETGNMRTFLLVGAL